MGQALSRGRFITFEGGEGAGKTTQIGLLAETLRQHKLDVVTTREPGGSPGAEAIRELLLSGAPDRWDGETEALLMVAARRDHLVATVWPALAAGRIVLCDRFADSTEAYQGFARGLARERLAELHRLAAGDFCPDLTFILDLPAAEGLARATKRGATTRFERMPLDLHERLRQGFLDIARREPQRCVVLDAHREVQAIHAEIVAALRERLKIAC
ncbi:MAG TPA: dTMP kinase [Stellaceae bacterium]|nr:dTMP kinase [Stellaceae bacterium]